MIQTGPQEHTPYGNQPALTHSEFLAQSVHRPKGPEKPDMPALPLENRLTRPSPGLLLGTPFNLQDMQERPSFVPHKVLQLQFSPWLQAAFLGWNLSYGCGMHRTSSPHQTTVFRFPPMAQGGSKQLCSRCHMGVTGTVAEYTRLGPGTAWWGRQTRERTTNLSARTPEIAGPK